MPYPTPAIVYDPGTGPVTLSFTFPPINKAQTWEQDVSNSGGSGNPSRQDSITLSGLKQSLWYRTDQFLTLQMEYVPIATDIPDWVAFIAYAITGGKFDYYPDATGIAFDTYTLEDTDWNPQFAFRAPDPAYAGIDKFALKLRLVVSGTSTGVFSGGTVTVTPPGSPPPIPPPSGPPVPPPGAEDMIDWVIMGTGTGGAPARGSQHLRGVNMAGTTTLYYAYLDTSGVTKIWQIKTAGGNPWDVLLVDGSYIYHWITEYAPGWSVANDFKRINKAAGSFPTAEGVPVMPRIFAPGSVGAPSSVTINVPKPNPQNDFISCVSQPQIELGDFKGVTSGLYSANFGGTLGTQNYILVTVYRGTAPNFKVRENFYYVKYWGFVKWESQSLSGSTWNTTNSSVHNIVVSGGGLTPNFPCGFAYGWWL